MPGSAFHRQIIGKSSCVKKETFQHQGIFVTSRNCNINIMLSIWITSRPSMRVSKWDQFSQFRWISTKENLYKRLKLAAFGWWIKGSRQAASERPTVICTRSDMTKIFHVRSYDRFKEMQSNLWRKKHHRTY